MEAPFFVENKSPGISISINNFRQNILYTLLL
jgi:hypothetical protein